MHQAMTEEAAFLACNGPLFLVVPNPVQFNYPDSTISMPKYNCHYKGIIMLTLFGSLHDYIYILKEPHCLPFSFSQLFCCYSCNIYHGLKGAVCNPHSQTSTELGQQFLSLISQLNLLG